MVIMLGYIGFKIGAGWFYWLCYILWIIVILTKE